MIITTYHADTISTRIHYDKTVTYISRAKIYEFIYSKKRRNLMVSVKAILDTEHISKAANNNQGNTLIRNVI